MPADLPKMIKGLELLSQSDPCVETLQQQTGEYVIVGAGELHLERCLRDLRDRFANVEIQASKPIVPFRETAVKASGENDCNLLHLLLSFLIFYQKCSLQKPKTE